MSDVGIWCLVGVVALNTLFIAGIAVALFMLHQKIEQALEKSTPLLNQTTATLTKLEATTAQLQQRVDAVLDKTTKLVDQVSDRVDTTTAIAEEAVTEPLIGAASLMAGIHRGLKVYSERAHEKGDGRNVDVA